MKQEEGRAIGSARLKAILEEETGDRYVLKTREELIDHDLDLIRATCTDVTVLDFGAVIYHGDTTLALSDPRVSEAYLGREANNTAEGDHP